MRLLSMKIQKRKILDVNVSVLNYDLVIKEVEKIINFKEKGYLCVSAVHLLVECHKDSELKDGVNKANMVTTDGMPLVWVMKYLWGMRETERVYGPDLTLRLCELALKKDYKIFLLGGSDGESAQVALKLKERFVGLKIVGNVDTPIRPIPGGLDKKIVREINSLKPEIVFVALGCPLQEKWMIQNINSLNKGVLVGVGAAFDFISGKTRQANKIIQRLGLEWLYRLIQDPKRLCYRYTVCNFKFLYFLIKETVWRFSSKIC